MTDRELLELAAKAAGMEGRYASLDDFPDWMVCHDGEGIYYTSSQAWNPLIDDGDALRLAVKLGLLVDTSYCSAMPVNKTGQNPDDWSDGGLDDDPYAATRRAIVRAAAEIGKGDPLTKLNKAAEDNGEAL